MTAGRPKKYDFDKILPDICEEYVECDLSIKEILRLRGGPSFSYFYRQVWANNDWKAMWFEAERIKAASLDSDYVDIKQLALIAFHDKEKNANALKTLVDITKTRRGQLDAKFNDRDQRVVLEAGDSMRQIMTEGRQRIESKVIEGEYESDSE